MWRTLWPSAACVCHLLARNRWTTETTLFVCFFVCLFWRENVCPTTFLKLKTSRTETKKFHLVLSKVFSKTSEISYWLYFPHTRSTQNLSESTKWQVECATVSTGQQKTDCFCISFSLATRQLNVRVGDSLWRAGDNVESSRSREIWQSLQVK